MKKRMLLATLALVGLLSCTEDGIYDDIKTSESSNNVTKVAGDAKYDIAGYGYDITGILLESDNASSTPIIDMDRFVRDHSDKISIATSSKGDTEYFYGSTAKDYMKDVTTKLSLSTTRRILGVKPD